MRSGLRAVAETLAAFLLLYGLALLGPVIGLSATAFALALPVSVAPWTLLTSVYVHASLGHLLGNAIALGVVGPLVAHRTTWVRFHAFFVSTGAVAGLATVTLGAMLGGSTAVLGASGAVLALAGYLLAGNLATESVLGRVSLSPRTWTVVIVGLSIGVVVLTGGPGVALTAHVVGFLLGLVAGRLHLLRTR